MNQLGTLVHGAKDSTLRNPGVLTKVSHTQTCTTERAKRVESRPEKKQKTKKRPVSNKRKQDNELCQRKKKENKQETTQIHLSIKGRALIHEALLSEAHAAGLGRIDVPRSSVRFRGTGNRLGAPFRRVTRPQKAPFWFPCVSGQSGFF